MNPKCPVSGKVSYPTYDAAIKAARRMPCLWSPVDAYQCPRCPYFHLTSKRQADRTWRTNPTERTAS